MAIPASVWAPVSPSCLSSTSLIPIHLKTTIISFSTSIQSSSLHRSNSINLRPSTKPNTFICNNSSSTASTTTTSYEFSDGSDEVELRLLLGDESIQSSKDVLVDADESFLTIKMKQDGSFRTAMEISLYDKIKPAETIWLLDDDQLVVNLKKQDPDVKWPDITETWESLTVGVLQLLKGASIYLVGESSEINYKVSRELAVGLGYTPLDTKELLETFTKQTVDSLIAEGSNAVAETESAILESLSSHIRSVVATIGGQHGAAASGDRWRHLYSGFTVWLSQSEAKDEAAAKEEARINIQSGSKGFSNADVVVKLSGWDSDYSKTVAQATLSALKQLILSDKKLPGKKGLYIRLGCRGDWPNIKPPGWDPATGTGAV
ncbi:probable inactive shikimate kinase like 2, chloroplastic [Cynara cardunculus var. scolymus]|uniref:CS domain-containing protein n=1 Tax=Cynara cardunculus var. scolymus TaxID=59895 RepID=A0A103XGD5_CYNCS|nr:probable inactive shikimate kinase like 2, chloroplastic [Cynara cardunculus var. scolymus]KVH90216.1 CS domain-containing protein [Cynara cardunculus var. scolymus]